MKQRALLACALVLLTGCGHERSGSGKASLWVTRDRGAEVVLVRTVPAGVTALQALDREADIETRYGGRFVQSIQGQKGDLSRRRDWFWFLNGIEADRSAADYKLRSGDVEWWDLRSWRGRMREPVVVGAFPEPFLHGYDGKVWPTAIRYAPTKARGAKALGRLLRATSVEPVSVQPPRDANVLFVVGGPKLFAGSLRKPDGPAGSPMQFILAGDAVELARKPSKYRFRYRVP